jgi:hypothetical protein
MQDLPLDCSRRRSELELGLRRPLEQPGKLSIQTKPTGSLNQLPAHLVHGHSAEFVRLRDFRPIDKHSQFFPEEL